MKKQGKKIIKENIKSIIFSTVYCCLALALMICIWFFNNILIGILYTAVSILLITLFIFDIINDTKKITLVIDVLCEDKENETKKEER